MQDWSSAHVSYFQSKVVVSYENDEIANKELHEIQKPNGEWWWHIW